ncbi:putative pyrroloquinoline-quinone binding quinoprotein [Cellulomonas sp. PhB150]|nr:putative pyrroloquinoline-quinone binding quinoprotein [Cellulomonas sp. PhB150]
MQEVEILDLPGEPAPADELPPPRRGRWVALGVVAAVAAVLLVGQSVLDARERAAIAALADVDGVVAPVDENLQVLRTIPSTAGAAVWGTGGSVMPGEDGSLSYDWLDPDTGATLWTTPLLGPTPALVDVEHVSGLTTCEPELASRQTDVRDASRIVCLVTDGGVEYGDEGAPKLLVAKATHLVVLAAADGSVLGDWPIDPAVSMAVLPGLAVVTSTTDDATDVTAYDVESGEQRWSTTLDDSRPSTQWVGAWIARLDDLLVVQVRESRQTIMMAADGSVLRDLTSEQGSSFQGWDIDDTTGRLMFSSQASDGTSTMTVVAADGDPSKDRVLQGQQVTFGVDDGSVPGLVVTTDGAVRAWDARSGKALWSSGVAMFADQAMVLRGRVFIGTGDSVSALDARTGETLWTQKGEAGRYLVGLFTDGTHVLASLAAGGEQPSVLVAYVPSTGERAFQASLPPGIEQAMPFDKQLVGFDSETGDYVILG